MGIYFNVGEILAPALSPQDLFRLLYFSTFLGYDGLLHSTQRKIMTVDELKEVSGLKDGTWKNTIKTLLAEGYMAISNDGIQINPNFAVRERW